MRNTSKSPGNGVREGFENKLRSKKKPLLFFGAFKKPFFFCLTPSYFFFSQEKVSDYNFWRRQNPCRISRSELLLDIEIMYLCSEKSIYNLFFLLSSMFLNHLSWKTKYETNLTYAELVLCLDDQNKIRGVSQNNFIDTSFQKNNIKTKSIFLIFVDFF